MGQSTGRKPAISRLGGIFGEGGIEHYKTMTVADVNGNETTFKARLKEADQCGWQLDPQGTGIHCASTGRTKYAEAIAWLNVITCIVLIVYELYRMNIFNTERPNKTDYTLLITYSVFGGISLCYAMYFLLIRTNMDRYHYGTTSFWMGTETVDNKWSTEDIDRGPAWKAVHETEYISGIDEQAKRIMTELKKTNPELVVDITPSLTGKSKKEQKKILKELVSDKEPKVSYKLTKDQTIAKGKEAELLRMAGSQFGNVEKVKGKGKLLKGVGVIDETTGERVKGKGSVLDRIRGKSSVFPPDDGLRGYSKAGYCDICAEITGRPIVDSDGNYTGEQGDCNTIGRCWLAVVIFTIFGIYFAIVGSLVLADYDPTEEKPNPDDDGIFKIVIGVWCFIMFIICAISIYPMIWSAVYCPSGSEFNRKTWWGYYKSFRW